MLKLLLKTETQLNPIIVTYFALLCSHSPQSHRSFLLMYANDGVTHLNTGFKYFIIKLHIAAQNVPLFYRPLLAGSTDRH